jgi:ribosome modulation factor
MAKKSPAQQAAAEEAKQQKAAERKRPAQVAAPSNVTDETIQLHCGRAYANYREFQRKKADMDTARGVYRAGLKAAKDAGLEPEVITWYIDQLKREPEDIDRETRLRNRYAKVMGLPIGTQLGMFDEETQTTVATVIDEAQIADATGIDLEQAGRLGREAGRLGKPWDTCPFAEDTDQRNAWMKAWDEAQFDNTTGIQSLAPDPGLEVADEEVEEAEA